MIVKYVVMLVSFPFKIILFLVSPTYFKKVTNIGKILVTNDNVLDNNNFSKANRRVVVTGDDGTNIKVNKITSDKQYKKGASKASIDMQKATSAKIDYKKYPKALTKESVVDKKVYEVNQKTNKKIKYSDKEFTYTGDKLTRSDMRKVNNKIHN